MLTTTQRKICRTLRATRLTPKAVAKILDVPLAEVRKCQQQKDPRWRRPHFARFASSANSTKALTRSGAARGSRCPVALLEQLAGDDEWSVRAEVAHNKSTPERLLRRLAVDPHPAVRAAAAGSRSCPAEALWRLALDPNEEVRRIAGESPSRTP